VADFLQAFGKQPDSSASEPRPADSLTGCGAEKLASIRVRENLQRSAAAQPQMYLIARFQPLLGRLSLTYVNVQCLPGSILQ